MTPVTGGAVFLLTDYGDDDEFAGLTRAVVHRAAPAATVVDLTHAVPPFDVRAGALILTRCVGFIGPGVVVAVVDPGVGTARRAVAVEVRPDRGPGPTGPRYLVGPDNGLLGWALDLLGGPAGVAVLTPPPRPITAGVTSAVISGATFDGRDLFAPVAARLWAGAGLGDVGLPVDPTGLVRLDDPVLRVADGTIEAEVLWVDRFGNVQLSGGPDDADAAGLGPAATAGVDLTIGPGADRAATAGADRSATAGADPSVGPATRPVRWVAAFADLSADPTAHSATLTDVGAAGEVTDDPPVGLMVDANGRLALVCDRRPAATVLGVHTGDIVTLRRGAGLCR